MYDPVKDGVDKSISTVVYADTAPPPELSELVHCFWELRTTDELDDDFILHALPDACTNLLFNQLEPDIAGVTRLHTSHTTLNLGRSFHYAGIQLFPGVWRGDPEATVDHFVGEPYTGELALTDVGHRAARGDLAHKSAVFAEFVGTLTTDGLIEPNPVTAAILSNIDRISRVSEMATAAGLSPRQLQRVLRSTTGFTPHDLLKVLRIQHSFRQDVLLKFADQAHYIHSFREVTGYSPQRFNSTFDV